MNMIARKRWPVAARLVAGVIVSGLVAVLLVFASAPISESELISLHFPPEVETGRATNITETTTTLNGKLEDLGDTGSIAVSFEWGTDIEYGNETMLQPMITPGTFSYVLENLASSTIYHFRAKAMGNGYDYGEDMTFITL